MDRANDNVEFSENDPSETETTIRLGGATLGDRRGSSVAEGTIQLTVEQLSLSQGQHLGIMRAQHRSFMVHRIRHLDRRAREVAKISRILDLSRTRSSKFRTEFDIR
jgi:hypothetical protein